MKQAIETKFLGPTNHRGARVKAASGSGKSFVMEWNYAVSAEKNHEMAAKILCDQLRWSGDMIMGSLKNSYAHVFKE